MKNNYFDLNCDVDEYYREICKIPLLSASEEKELAIRMQCGDMEAKRKFIEANLRLVIYVARIYTSYWNYIPSLNNNFMDIIQEGNIGLMNAASKFDPEQGSRFSTFAVKGISFYVIKAIKKYVNQDKAVVENVGEYDKKVRDLAQELMHEPTIYEISERLNISLKKIDEYRIMKMKPISISEYRDEDDDRKIIDTIPDLKIDVEESAIAKVIIDNGVKIFNGGYLSEKERSVIYYLFGFDDKGEKTLEEVGTILGMTRQNVQRIRDKALKKIEHFEVENKNANTKDTTIYRLFLDYSKEEVDQAFSELKESDQILIRKRYGTNFNAIHRSELSGKELSRFYQGACRRMRRILEENHKNSDSTEVELDINSLKILKRISRKMKKKDFNILYNLVIKAKQNSILSSVDLIELISLLLYCGCVNNKKYLLYEIERIVCVDQNILSNIIFDSLEELKEPIEELQSEKELVKSI